mgnify:CR=1 FL=1
MIRKISFDDATREQLLKYANEVENLALHHSTGKNTIITKLAIVKPGLSAIEIEVADAPVAAAPALTPIEEFEDPKAVAARQAARDAQRVSVFIEIEDIAGGDRDVFVSYNGKSMLLPRGREVVIPWPFYEVLTKAVREVGEQKYDDRGMPAEIVYRKVPSYPFRMIRQLAA